MAAAKTAIMIDVLQMPMTRKAPRPRASVLSFLRLPNHPSTRERRLNLAREGPLPDPHGREAGSQALLVIRGRRP